MVKIFRVAAIVLAIVSIFWGIYSYINESKFISNSIEADGVIVDFVSKFNAGSKLGFSTFAVVQFTLKDGRISTFDAIASGYSKQYFGEHVKVLYNPKNPQDARIEDFFNLHTGSIGALAMFIISLLILLAIKFFKKFEIKLSH